MFVANENENKQLFDEKNNQKFLANSGVCVYFSNVFDYANRDRVPMIKHKLRKILVDFALCQTCMEISQELNYIKVWYIDPKSTELRGILLQRYNDKEHKSSQAIELNISLEGSLVTLPEKEGKIKSYSGLTKLIYQEFIQSTESSSMLDDDPYNQMRKIIEQGNSQPSLLLTSNFGEGVD